MVLNFLFLVLPEVCMQSQMSKIQHVRLEWHGVEINLEKPLALQKVKRIEMFRAALEGESQCTITLDNLGTFQVWPEESPFDMTSDKGFAMNINKEFWQELSKAASDHVGRPINLRK